MELYQSQHRPPLAIRFAPPGKLARAVVKRSNARMTSKYPSWKMQSMLQCESENERNGMLLLDVCPGVSSFRPQPCEIRYLQDGEEHRHFPDILVHAGYRKFLVEIKTRKDATKPEIAERTALMSALLPSYGYQYLVLLAEDLALNPRLQNADDIKRRGSIDITPLERERIRRMFEQYESLPWGALQQDTHHPGLSGHICRLLLEGYLHIDLNQALTDETPVRRIINTNHMGETSWESLISKKAL